MMKIYEIWQPAKNIFKKPKINLHIGTGPYFYGFLNKQISHFTPISVESSDIEYKDKDNSPRIEKAPWLSIIIFGFLQIYLELGSPVKVLDEDQYWEQLLWTRYYLGEDPSRTLEESDWEKAKETWPWYEKKNSVERSTWIDEFHV